jgi:hypothetical protein
MPMVKLEKTTAIKHQATLNGNAPEKVYLCGYY